MKHTEEPVRYEIMDPAFNTLMEAAQYLEEQAMLPDGMTRLEMIGHPSVVALAVTGLLGRLLNK